MQPTPAPPIPWRVELQAVLRDGYVCRRCRATVLGDDERRAVAIRPFAPLDLGNVLTYCRRCATDHDHGKH